MAIPKLTDRTILATAQLRPMTGDVITAARAFLTLSTPTLALFLEVPEQQLLDLETAGSQAVVPDDLADDLANYIAECLDVMTPAELRSARDALGLTSDDLGAAIDVGDRRIQRAEDGRQLITEMIRDRTLALVERADAETSALIDHLRSLPHEGQPVVWTYQKTADLFEAQEQLPAAPAAGIENPITALLRSSPSPNYHRSIAGRAARAVGARLRYR